MRRRTVNELDVVEQRAQPEGRAWRQNARPKERDRLCSMCAVTAERCRLFGCAGIMCAQPEGRAWRQNALS